MEVLVRGLEGGQALGDAAELCGDLNGWVKGCVDMSH